MLCSSVPQYLIWLSDIVRANESSNDEGKRL